MSSSESIIDPNQTGFVLFAQGNLQKKPEATAELVHYLNLTMKDYNLGREFTINKAKQKPCKRSDQKSKKVCKKARQNPILSKPDPLPQYHSPRTPTLDSHSAPVGSGDPSPCGGGSPGPTGAPVLSRTLKGCLSTSISHTSNSEQTLSRSESSQSIEHPTKTRATFPNTTTSNQETSEPTISHTKERAIP